MGKPRTPRRPSPQSMTCVVETHVPAIQAEQVEDDVAPVTAEYVPAKARDEECVRARRFEDKALAITHERRRQEDGGGCTFFYSDILVSKWHKRVEDPHKAHKAPQGKT